MEYEEMMERMSLGGESIEDIVVGEEEDEEDASEFGDQSFVSEDESFNEHDLDGEYEHDGDDGDDHELEEEEEEEGDQSDDDYQDSDSNDYDGDSESDYEDVNETINAQEEDEEEEEDDDDFDTQYEQMISTKRSRRRAGGSGGSSITPSDYNEVVNQGVRSEDGMFHWSSPDTTNADDDNERQMMMASMANDDNNLYPSRKKVFLADLDQPNSTLLVAQGGKAGVGNQAYANRPYFSNMEANAAKKSIPGMGECTYLELELKLIADVGLVGFPNAGKSSLLSAMSRAKPKIASYPFTTLHPLVGSIQYRDGYQIVMADVPGLIEGAAEGRGRGIEFLRHIERTKVLVYMVDSAGVDGRDPVSDLKVLGKELREYGSSGIFGKNEIEGEGGEYEEEMRRRRREIMNRPSLILANKMDLIPEVDANIGRREEIIFLLGQAAEEVGIICDPGDIMGISAGVTGEGLQALSKQLRRTVLDL
jgi:Obg family GTPase CgtA